MLLTIIAFVLYLVALVWTGTLLVRTRNWRFLALIAMLTLLALWHLLAFFKEYGIWNSPLVDRAASVFGFALAVLALLSVVFIEVVFSEQRKREKRLQYDAFHDALTGLPNRSLLLDRLRIAIDRWTRREQDLFALLFLDVDGFKQVNDTYGHQVGDELLIELARRLEGCLRASDTVARIGSDHTLARLGGDEFTILLCGLRDDSDAVRVADRLLRELQTPISLRQATVKIGVSIGIAYGNGRHVHPEQVLRDADTAMYRAKAQGKNRIEVFDKAIHAEALNRLRLESELRKALNEDDFSVYYQPIVDLQTGNPVGVEALVRWHHPDQGPVPPAVFLPIAADAGLMVPIDCWVLRRACSDLAHILKSHPEPFYLSVNLSSSQFGQVELGQSLEQILEETGVDPQRLQLEVTEPVIMASPEASRIMLEGLHQRQIRVVVDDYGTGMTSVVQLNRFELDGLKIARSIVETMASAQGGRIIQAIVAMAQALELQITAKGVETAEQIQRLKQLGCNFAQGYYYCKPVRADEVQQSLADLFQATDVGTFVGEPTE